MLKELSVSKRLLSDTLDIKPCETAPPVGGEMGRSIPEIRNSSPFLVISNISPCELGRNSFLQFTKPVALLTDTKNLFIPTAPAAENPPASKSSPLKIPEYNFPLSECASAGVLGKP